jgi:hypothetical protein
MKKIILSFSLILFAASSQAATTWYVRPDGGSSTQCTGKTDAAYSGQGTLQPCAFSHPFYVTGVVENAGGAPAKWVGGDTLIIGTGSYKMGYGAPNTNCGQSYPYDCYMRSIPSGTETNHTKILGKGYDTGCQTPPELWGNEKAYVVLNMRDASSHVDISCLEITDHSSCRQGGAVSFNQCSNSSYPYGTWAQNGLIAVDSTDVSLTNVNIHGMAYSGMYTARLSNWTMDGLKLNGNGQVGWHGEHISGQSSNSGNIILRHAQINWNGCAESYPGKVSPVTGSCCSQGQQCYTDGIGMADSGGNYLIEDSEVSWNSEDGIDLLHVSKDPTSLVIVRRVRSEGNSGNNVKIGAAQVIAENNILIGACDYISNNFSAPGYDNYCRGGGEPLAINIQTSSHQKVYNNTIIQTVSGKNSSITNKEGGPDCDGTESIEMRNNIWFGGNYQMYDDVLNGAICTGWNYTKSVTSQYSIENSVDHPIAGLNILTADPLLSASSLVYTPNAKVDLTSSSPALNVATKTIAFTDLPDDFFHAQRGDLWDLGSVEYTSSTTTTTTTTGGTTTGGTTTKGKKGTGGSGSGKGKK